MSKQEKPNSRWVRGNERYDKKTLDYIYSHYREQPDWYNGARVRKKDKS